MSLSEKLIDVNLASSKSSELGKKLVLFRGVHLEAKNLLKQ